MSMFDLFCIIPALLILITAAARLNDIKPHQRSKRWWARRCGLLAVAVSMVMMVASYVTTTSPHWFQITRGLLLWGFATVWITTPGMPPWWKWISRYDPEDTAS